MQESSLEIRLNRLDRVYRPNEKVDGVVVVNAYKGWSHSGIQVEVEGLIFLSHNNRGIVGIRGDLGNRPTSILKTNFLACGPGKFPDGSTEVPFEFLVQPAPGQQLFESYHGVFVSVVYIIQVICDRGVMKKSLQKELEFLLELPGSQQHSIEDSNPQMFTITPESLENVSAKTLATIPKFSISGKLHRTKCPINQPLTGEVVIELAEAPVKAIELQLIRVETVDAEGKHTKEATEIQTIQIGDGNICRNLSVPMYMVFPRLFSCPTVQTASFKIEFELNIIIVYADGYMLTENFPLVLYREKAISL
eukprot:gene7458-8045_t